VPVISFAIKYTIERYTFKKRYVVYFKDNLKFSEVLQNFQS